MKLIKSLRQRGITGTYNKIVNYMMRRGGWSIMNRFAKQTQHTIYHCCVQKTASQWFVRFWTDPLFWEHYNLKHFWPEDNFTVQRSHLKKKLNNIPWGRIIAPLYIKRSDFVNMKKSPSYRAVFVARDPRDLVISQYFSLKYSHPLTDPVINKKRELLNSIPVEEGILELINNFIGPSLETLEGWMNFKDEAVRIFLFEDLFGDRQLFIFKDLMEHCRINMSEDILSSLLKKHSFKKITGRDQGDESQNNHYRKGVPGDWKNHFTAEHKNAFKDRFGSILINLGYETDSDW